MTVAILKNVPISGSHAEYLFSECFNSPIWIEFKSDEIWYGCFDNNSETSFCTTFVSNNAQIAFIVAGRQGFLIDTVTKKLIVKTNEIDSAIKTTNPELFIVARFQEHT
jgi:hypothetical protein